MSVKGHVRGRLFAERGSARRRRTALRAGLACVLLTGWLLIAYGWAPLLLEAGYRQESIGLINDQFPGRAANPFENYLDRWRRLARLGTLWCVAVCVGVLFGRRIRAHVPAFFERFVGVATPGALGAIRAWTCAILFYQTLFHHGPAGTAFAASSWAASNGNIRSSTTAAWSRGTCWPCSPASVAAGGSPSTGSCAAHAGGPFRRPTGPRRSAAGRGTRCGRRSPWCT